MDGCSAAWCVNRAASAALATDLLPAEELGRGLPRLGSMDSIASIVGFAASGFVMDTFGGSALYGLAIVLALAAVVALVGLTLRRREAARAQTEVLAIEPLPIEVR